MIHYLTITYIKICTFIKNHFRPKYVDQNSFSVKPKPSSIDTTQSLYLKSLSNDGKLDAKEWRALFTEIYGADYFTEKFFQDVIIQKGDKDGDNRLSIVEITSPTLDLKNNIQSPTFCNVAHPGDQCGLYVKFAASLPSLTNTFPSEQYLGIRY